MANHTSRPARYLRRAAYPSAARARMARIAEKGWIREALGVGRKGVGATLADSVGVGVGASGDKLAAGETEDRGLEERDPLGVGAPAELPGTLGIGGGGEGVPDPTPAHSVRG